MAKVGYIFEANSYDAFDADKEWMRQYGCVQVVEESVGHETLRPRWKQLMSNLERGDELVMSKFSNAVRGLRELSALIELCRIKVVRIISIHDKIDTDNKLFPDTTPRKYWPCSGHYRRKWLFCGSRRIKLYACSRVSVFRFPKKYE